MKWTKKQAEAIEKRNKNLMVAAAAGSGKTAVLVERIKQLIISEGCSIDRMLVVTFTNAAASEMKTKIETAIYDEISRLGSTKDKENEETIKHLKKQLDLLPLANISTFHSFAMEVIRKYFHILDLEPDFKICDETRKSLLLSKAMDEVIASEYEEGKPEFYNFLNKFSGDRNDDNTRGMIASVYNRMESLPEPFEWLKQSVDFTLIDKEGFIKSSAMSSFMDMAAGLIEDALFDLKAAGKKIDGERLQAAKRLYIDDVAMVENVTAEFESGEFDKACEAVSSFELRRMEPACFSSKKNPDFSEEELSEIKGLYSGARDVVKKTVKGLKEMYFNRSLEETLEQIRETHEDIVFLAELVKKFDTVFSSMKREKGLMDFSDIEHFAYKILKDDEAAAHYRDKFEYVFVDEYQDSNMVQEELIKRIVRPDNLFTVGDIKQSIYHFRLAEPEIFRNRYEEYKKTEGPSEKIDLNLNFRSKTGIIDFINAIFVELMDGYDEDAMLYAGDEHADKNGFPPKLYLCNATWDDSAEIDDEIKTLQKTEKEALMVAGIIKNHVGSAIFDSKQQKERELTFRDIVILMRGLKGYGDIYCKVLMDNGIPAFVDDNEGYFDTIEITAMLALLALLDNCKQDIPLLTAMRSEIFGFTVSELAEIRIGFRQKTYYDAVKEYSEDGESDELKKKCADTLEFISRWQKKAILIPIEELVWELLLETGFYIAMGALPGGALRQANLRILVDKARDYRKMQEEGLYGFITYIEKIRENKVRMGQAAMVGEEDDIVRIMTIHHSKGLEYPMVILSGYGRELNYSKSSKHISIHKDIGIGLPNVSPDENWLRKTFTQNLTSQKIKSEEVEEEKRILYVAMTRAKDILIMTGTVNDFDEYLGKMQYMRRGNSSYLAMTAGTIFSNRSNVVFISDEELKNKRKIRRANIEKTLKLIEDSGLSSDENTDKKMSFAYPFKKEQNAKSKYSVSELNDRQKKKEIVFSGNIPTNIRKTRLNAAEIGMLMHLVFEKLDFSRAGEAGYIDSLISHLITNEFISEEEAKYIDTAKISMLTSSSLGKRMAAAHSSGRLYREKPFNRVIEVDGTEGLVQGVIDCFFVEEGEEGNKYLVLVDYKTTGISNHEELKSMYKVQTDIYAEALSEAYGLPVQEAYLYLTNTGETVKMRVL